MGRVDLVRALQDFKEEVCSMMLAKTALSACSVMLRNPPKYIRIWWVLVPHGPLRRFRMWTTAMHNFLVGFGAPWALATIVDVHKIWGMPEVT